MSQSKTPKKPVVKFDFDFVKEFIEAGLRLHNINFTTNEMMVETGNICYILTDDGLYGFFAISKIGKFECWVRNNGAAMAAKKEGFSDKDLLNQNIDMGLPIWLELPGPEELVGFLSKRSFGFFSKKRKVITWTVI